MYYHYKCRTKHVTLSQEKWESISTCAVFVPTPWPPLSLRPLRTVHSYIHKRLVHSIPERLEDEIRMKEGHSGFGMN